MNNGLMMVKVSELFAGHANGFMIKIKLISFKSSSEHINEKEK